MLEQPCATHEIRKRDATNEDSHSYPARQFAAKQATVTVAAATVGEALDELTSTHPELKKHLYSEEGKLRAFVNVYLNDEDIRYLSDKENTAVKDSDSLSIIPSIAGGSKEDEHGDTYRSTRDGIAVAQQRRNRALLPPPDFARGRHGGAAETQSGQGALRGHRRPGFALGLLPCRGGRGTLGLVDFDVVDSSNLQRQIIHSTKDVGRLKLDSAEEKLKALNPFMKIVKFNTMLLSKNAMEIFKDFDIVADGTDNFPTRYLVNDACVLSGKPNVYGSIFRFEGPGQRLCHRAGTLLPVPLSGAAAAGLGSFLCGRRGAWDPARAGGRDPGDRGHQADPGPGRAADRAPAAGGFVEHALPRAEAAQEPGLPGMRHASDRDQADRLRAVLRHPAGAGARCPLVNGIEQIPVTAFKQQRDAGKDYFLLDVREPHEFKIAEIGGYLIPLGDLQKRVGELDKQPRDRGPLQDGRPQPESGGVPAAGRVQGKEPGRRHSGLERADRSPRAQVLLDVSGRPCNKSLPHP
jgi:molybdopterin converting factor small subunit